MSIKMSRIKETNLFLYRTTFGIFNMFIMREVLEKTPILSLQINQPIGLENGHHSRFGI